MHNTPVAPSSCLLTECPDSISSLRPSDETHPTVTADGTVDNLAQAVDVILSHRRWLQKQQTLETLQLNRVVEQASGIQLHFNRVLFPRLEPCHVDSFKQPFTCVQYT